MSGFAGRLLKIGGQESLTSKTRGAILDAHDAEITAAVAKAEEGKEALLKALEGMVNIVSDSNGVVGYHLNGDIAEWDEFEEVETARALLKEPGR